MVGHIFWDPNPTAFTVPLIDHPIAWYGILFASGFLIGFYLLKSLFKRYAKAFTDRSDEDLNKKALLFCERLTVYVIVSTVSGARLGHILFYEKWSHYLSHPLDIIKTWEGGLASHGGVAGILIGLILFYKKNRQDFPIATIVRIIDLMVVPALPAATLIRIGNFINQEVLGVPGTVPWAIIFGHPIDGSFPTPRHPAQLYEAIFYFIAFLFFWRFFSKLLRPVGRLAGCFFVTIFSFRFLIEFIKEEQSRLVGEQWLTMGQWLSIPMILFGLILFITGVRKGREESIDLKV
ncbi:MAG: prolipoprotein diacylglyceryl transferase [Chlamydiota bacterium]